MTLAELQALVMAQAVAKLERLKTEQEAKRAAPPPEQEPTRLPWRLSRDEYLHDEIEAQELVVAKLVYLHEREESELARAQQMQALEMSERLARIDEIEHLIDHRNGVLAAFKLSNELHQAGNDIAREGLGAIAEAIKGRA